jgi:glycosyltransferase involved in cell wall biosynthesis
MFDTTEYLLKIKDYVTNRRDINVIGSCEWMTRKIKESHLSNSDIYTIYNGIDVGKYTPNQSADLNVKIPNTSDLKLLFVSSDFNNRRKGLDLLLDSLEKVNNKYQISLIAVGNGHIPEQRVPENVKIHTLGYVNPDHMPTVYNIADVCVLTSRGETFNLTSLEAMACQTPVVAFDTGGLREQITKQTGWIIEKENINQFSEQIECIIENKEDIHTISKNARKRIVANFSLELMIDNYINRYRKILNS